jgi:hypothetical protein
LVSTEDLLAFLFRVAIGLGVLRAALGAVFAQKALFSVRGHPIANDIFALAIAAGKLNRNHEARVPHLPGLIHYLRRISDAFI